MPHTSLLVTPHASRPSAAPRRYNALPGAQAAVRQLAADGRAVQGLLTGNLEATAALKLATAGFDYPWVVQLFSRGRVHFRMFYS
jgi:hypothetical protein